MHVYVCLILRSSELLVPVTITSSVTYPDENKKEKEKESEKHSDDITSIDVRPTHTTPDPKFGTEVRKNGSVSSNFIIFHRRERIKGKIDFACK